MSCCECACRSQGCKADGREVTKAAVPAARTCAGSLGAVYSMQPDGCVTPATVHGTTLMSLSPCAARSVGVIRTMLRPAPLRSSLASTGSRSLEPAVTKYSSALTAGGGGGGLSVMVTVALSLARPLLIV